MSSISSDSSTSESWPNKPTGGLRQFKSDNAYTKPSFQFEEEPEPSAPKEATSEITGSQRDRVITRGVTGSEKMPQANRLEQARDRTNRLLGKYSPDYVNSIGRLFLEQSRPTFQRLTSKKVANRAIPSQHTSLLQISCVLDELIRSFSTFSEIPLVFGKLSNVLSNCIAEDYAISFEKLNSLCSKRLPQLANAESNQKFINELNALGYTSIPDLDPSLFFSTTEEGDDEESY